MQTQFPKRSGVRAARWVNGTWGLEAVIMLSTDYKLVGGSVCVCVGG